MKCPHCGEEITVSGSLLGVVSEATLAPRARLMVDLLHVAPGCQEFIADPISVLNG